MRKAFRDNEDIAKQLAFRKERIEMQNKQTSTDNADVIKAAAKRMCEQLNAKGVRVKHSLMLEALAQGLGLDCWRNLKAIIDAPRDGGVVKSEPVRITAKFQDWVVSGLYLDNQQQYGDTFSGRTPLEAAIAAMVERLTDYGSELGILEVRDSKEVVWLSPGTLGEIELLHNYHALAALRDELTQLRLAGKLSESERVGTAWLSFLLKLHGREACEELTDYTQLQRSRVDAADSFLNDGGAQTPSQVLTQLCEAVERCHGGAAALEKSNEDLALAAYQIRAICDYFGNVLNDAAVGGFAGVMRANLKDTLQ